MATDPRVYMTIADVEKEGPELEAELTEVRDALREIDAVRATKIARRNEIIRILHPPPFRRSFRRLGALAGRSAQNVKLIIDRPRQ